jgi:ATP-dependent RNA helicase DeaD
LIEITKFTNAKIKKRNIPTPEKVLKVKQEQDLEEINDIIENINTGQYDDMADQLISAYEPTKVVAALLHKIDKKDVSKKVNGDINDQFTPSSKGNKNSATTRYHLNVGRKDGVTPKIMADVIKKKTNLHNKQIDDIIISENASFFTTDSKKFNQVMKSMTNIKILGKKTSIQEARVRKGKKSKRRKKRG